MNVNGVARSFIPDQAEQQHHVRFKFRRDAPRREDEIVWDPDYDFREETLYWEPASATWVRVTEDEETDLQCAEVLCDADVLTWCVQNLPTDLSDWPKACRGLAERLSIANCNATDLEDDQEELGQQPGNDLEMTRTIRISELAKAWGETPKVMSKLLRQQQPRNMKINRQSYRVAIKDLPPGVLEKLQKGSIGRR